MDEALLIAWHVGVGDVVDRDQPIAELETDKATLEYVCPVSGTVSEFFKKPGEILYVGDEILAIDTDIS